MFISGELSATLLKGGFLSEFGTKFDWRISFNLGLVNNQDFLSGVFPATG
jgi:hypothetical protein